MPKARKMKVVANPKDFFKAHQEDAGIDLRIHEDVTLSPDTVQVVSTKVRAAIPTNCVGLVTLRSSIGARGVIIPNAPGIIDPGYTGEILLTLSSLGKKQTLFAGERVAQLIVMPLQPVNLEYVEKLEGSERGEGGFGSTGRT